MRRIGLTGAIAAGKSRVSRYLAQKGIPVVDADVLSRAVVAPGSPGLAKIAQHFGAQTILQADGSLNRSALAGIIFADEGQRQWLNRTLHPQIAALAQQQLDAWAKEGYTLAVFDVALLFEAHFVDMVDDAVLVYCEDHQRRKRLMQRDGLDEQAALARMNSQLSQKTQCALADIIIDNSGTWAQTQAQIDRLLAQWNKEVGALGDTDNTT